MHRIKRFFYFSIIFTIYLVTADSFKAQTLEGDPFAPFLTEKSPRIINRLSVEVIQGIKVERLVFYSRDQKNGQTGEASVIFAAVYRPQDNKQYPGLLILHGGQGAAETDKAFEWAKRGYIVVAPDLPGIAAPEKIPFSQGSWKTKSPADYITDSSDVTASPIFDAVLASVQSLYLLRAQPNIIREKIGVIGYAWGGYAATMVGGLTGKDVSAVFSVFGTGFYDAGSYWQIKLEQLAAPAREKWLRFLDAGRRASQIKANYFLATSTNHPYFWLPSAQATLNAISAPKNQLFAPNATTLIPLSGGTGPPGEAASIWTEMEKSFFSYQLKGSGEPFPVVKTLADFKIEKDVVRTRFRVEGAVTEVTAFYSLALSAASERRWQKAVVRGIGKEMYEAVIPIEAARQGADWYALAASSHPATVSSLIAVVPKTNP